MNTPANREVSWLCPKCKVIPTEQVVIYNEALRVQQFEISPILPTCLTCGAEVALIGHPLDGNAHKFIVLTGTCASGKTTTAQALMANHGFAVIDGDCVMNVIRHKTGVRKVDFNGPAMLAEIACEIDILLALGKDIVLSQVIIPSDLPAYRELFQSRRLNYAIFVLQPDYQSAVARSQTRTCFNHITPEIWVKHFHDLLSNMPHQDCHDIVMFDNSKLSVAQSVESILRLYKVRG
jgi:gluconate kinase